MTSCTSLGRQAVKNSYGQSQAPQAATSKTVMGQRSSCDRVGKLPLVLKFEEPPGTPQLWMVYYYD